MFACLLKYYRIKNRTTLLGLAGLNVLKNKAAPTPAPDALAEPSTRTDKGASIGARIGNLNTVLSDPGTNDSGLKLGAQLNVMAGIHIGLDPSVDVGPTQPDSAAGTSSSRVSRHNPTADAAMVGNHDGNAIDTALPTTEAPPSEDPASMATPDPKMNLEQMHDKLFDELDHARTGTLAGKKVKSIYRSV